MLRNAQTIMLTINAITGLPEIKPGDDLAGLLAEALYGAQISSSDILVIAQKIISKSEDRYVTLTSIKPSSEALLLAARTGKDPALVELILRESSEIVRAAPNVIIARHRSGHVMANAGIDTSNLGPGRDDDVLLLPENSDASAARMAENIKARLGFSPAIVISDSFGRPWRMGTVNVAIGIWGLPATMDQRGTKDRNGRVMRVTEPAIADAAAAAAGLVMGETAQSIPAAIIRGLVWTFSDAGSGGLIRPEKEDLFR